MTTNAPVGPPICTRDPPSAEMMKPATIAVHSPRSGVTPLAMASKVSDEARVVSERTIDRGEAENLQRWVSAGHADWCKDARLVAAEELWRLAPEYSGHGFELNAVNAERSANAGDRVTFEWTPLDGRVVYRVTVERFDWLLPIAKNADAIIWIPTSTEIRVHE